MKFSDNLRNIRLQRGLTQMELAKDLGTSQSSITSWEQERREPDFRTLQKLADYFGVPLSALLPSDDSSDPDYYNVVVNSFNTNQKLRTLFDITRNFSDRDLDALIAVARSISNKNL